MMLKNIFEKLAKLFQKSENFQKNVEKHRYFKENFQKISMFFNTGIVIFAALKLFLSPLASSNGVGCRKAIKLSIGIWTHRVQELYKASAAEIFEEAMKGSQIF